jgi:hypothetical protein
MAGIRRIEALLGEVLTRSTAAAAQLLMAPLARPTISYRAKLQVTYKQVR